MFSTVTTKGQITIPAEIRARFHIQSNDKVDFFVDGERIVITPVKTLKQLRGTVPITGSGAIADEKTEAKRVLGKRIAGES